LNPVWSHGIAVAAISALVTAAFWFAAGPALALLGFAVVVLVWAIAHLRQTGRLLGWLEGPIDAAVPEASGLWGRVFSDIHRRARVRSEQHRDLTVALERFRTAAEALPDGMVILDPHGCVVWGNPRAQQLLGIHPVKDLGHPLPNIVRQPEFIAYLDSGDYRDSVVFRSSREPGATLSVQIVPYGTDQRLLMCRDITQIEEVARMRRDFIANVSHELKTPLTVLAGFLETLRELPLEAEQRQRYIGLMEEQARSMQRLVEDLLTLSALESEDNPLREEVFDVAELMDAAERDANALSAGQHPIAVEVESGARLRGSRDELASVLLNLVSNAVRYTGGTGLGLAIVKHVLMRHGAELVIESDLGSGSTFTVRFPAERLVELAQPGPGVRAMSSAA
jgi:two-component system phosphate regulon sensor histidine kinase PhoR